jgi:mercuric ion transport protein
MNNKTMLKTGIIGSAIAAVCCFTPALVLLIGAVGLSAWLAWLDYVLLPALIIFLSITVFTLIRQVRASNTGAASGDRI